MNNLAIKSALAVALLAPCLACSPAVKMPRLYNPGPAGYQRFQATQGHDPYPLPDAGPEIVGGRPREFQLPTPQVERARQFSRQQVAPQYVAPAPQPIYPSYPAYPAQ